MFVSKNKPTKKTPEWLEIKKKKKKYVLTEVCLVSAAFQSSGTCHDAQILVPYFFLSFCFLVVSPAILSLPSFSVSPPLSCQSQLQAEDLSFVNNSQVD